MPELSYKNGRITNIEWTDFLLDLNESITSYYDLKHVIIISSPFNINDIINVFKQYFLSCFNSNEIDYLLFCLNIIIKQHLISNNYNNKYIL